MGDAIVKLLVAVALLLSPTIARAEALELLCHGTATHVETTETTATVHNDRGDSASGDETTYAKARSTESVRVRIDAAGGGKIKPPTVLQPVISRGKDGWWDLSGLVITDDLIRGQYSLNIINHPSVVIDRHTGEIDMKGLGLKFNGMCERVADAPESRKF